MDGDGDKDELIEVGALVVEVVVVLGKLMFDDADFVTLKNC